MAEFRGVPLQFSLRTVSFSLHFQCDSFCSAALLSSLILSAVKLPAIEANLSVWQQGRKAKSLKATAWQFSPRSAPEVPSPAGTADQQKTLAVSPGFSGHTAGARDTGRFHGLLGKGRLVPFTEGGAECWNGFWERKRAVVQCAGKIRTVFP